MAGYSSNVMAPPPIGYPATRDGDKAMMAMTFILLLHPVEAKGFGKDGKSSFSSTTASAFLPSFSVLLRTMQYQKQILHTSSIFVVCMG